MSETNISVGGVVMPHLECWILVSGGEVTTSQCEFGIGVVHGIDFGLVCAAEKDIFEYAREYFNENEDAIPKNASFAVFRVTNFVRDEGQMTFPETGQWDFPPHWEVDLEFIRYDLIPDELA